jgi:hypothetical protein
MLTLLSEGNSEMVPGIDPFFGEELPECKFTVDVISGGGSRTM